jgi:uncharacterized protein involved in response to NO
MHLAIIKPQMFSINLSGYASILLITFLISVMAGRVTPMFTANGTQTSKASPAPWLDKLTNGSLAVLMIILLLHPIVVFNSFIFAILLIIAGVFQAIRWTRWKPWITLAVPLLWSLHLALKFIWFGLIILGISYLVPEMPSNHVWHLLTVGGIGGLILAMISRVSLGHTGRPLTTPKAMALAFVLITTSALVRTIGPWLMPESTSLFIDISALCWILSFVIFVYYYGPMLTTARVDDRPG